MTIESWVLCIFLTLFIIGVAFCIFISFNSTGGKAATLFVAFLVVVAIFFGFRWYHANTASGRRALIDQKSNLRNGLERTVTVYTANGDVIAQYVGKIDIETNDGGYIKFDFNGKRYIYYNCFVESVADLN